MKKTPFAALLLTTVLCYGQIEVSSSTIGSDSNFDRDGKITALGMLLIKCEKSGDEYKFTYKDRNSNVLRSFRFRDIDGSFEKLYQVNNGRLFKNT